jgi:four helix bundle protein
MTGRNTAMARSPEEFKKRTKRFALRVIRLVETLEKRGASEVIGKQLLRSASSVGANYRSACRARSPAEFCAKLGVVEEEADESAYWIELLIDSGLVRESLLKNLLEEANAITAMVAASIVTTRKSESSRKR